MNLGRKDFIDDLHTMFPVTKKNALYFFFTYQECYEISLSRRNKIFLRCQFPRKGVVGRKSLLRWPPLKSKALYIYIYIYHTWKISKTTATKKLSLLIRRIFSLIFGWFRQFYVVFFATLHRSYPHNDGNKLPGCRLFSR